MFKQLLEKLKRPGLLGVIGMRVEKRCREQLHLYFNALGQRIAAMGLEQLADPDSFVHDALLGELARHTVEMRLTNTLRSFTPLLKGVLEINIHDALIASNKIHHFAEADDTSDDPESPSYVPGMTSEEAALYASVRAGELVSGINATTQNLIADAIEEGITERLGVDGTKRLLLASIKDMGANRARMIASTEMNDAFSEATMRKLNRLQVAYKQWITSADACDEICVPNEEQGAIPIDELFQSGDARPPGHPNCLTGDAIVASSCPITAQTIRQFEGEIIILRCEGMDDLSITPNHPVLTDAGWIAAGQLKQGMNLIKHLRPRNTPPIVGPNDYLVPTRFENVSHALLEAGGMATGPMPTSSKDFHGDAASNGEVDIVLSAGFLANERKLGETESVGTLPLPSRHLGGFGFTKDGECFPSSSHISQDFERLALSPNGIVGGYGSGSTDGGRSATVLEQLGLGSSANLETSALESLDNGVAVNSDSLRDSLGRIPRDVPFVEARKELRRPVDGVPVSFPSSPSRKSDSVAVAENEATLPKSIAQDVPFNSDTLSNICERFASEIALVKLGKVFKRQFCGQVYNLETRDGYYFANGLIVHNCRCAVSGARAPAEA